MEGILGDRIVLFIAIILFLVWKRGWINEIVLNIGFVLGVTMGGEMSGKEVRYVRGV